MLVDKYYEMNPETEIRINQGNLLKDGMVVLHADPAYRCDTEDRPHFDAAQVSNRWAKISDVTKHNHKYQSTYITFIAEYEDGSRRSRMADIQEPWLVKIDSTPEYRQQRKVLDLVKRAIAFYPDQPNPDSAKEYALDITEKILKIFGEE